MVSILLPVYNGEKYLKKSIDSVISQEFTNFELLIGFNGTIDNSRNIANSYDDDRIRIIDYGEDKGKAKTLNKLLKEAKYGIIALQDDDDVWLPSKLKLQIDHIQEFDIVGTQITYIDENDAQIIKKSPLILHTNHENIMKSMLAEGDNHIANSSAIFRKHAATEIGGWDDALEALEDLDFWIRLFKADRKFHNINQFLVLHRIHNQSNFNAKKLTITPYDILTKNKI